MELPSHVRLYTHPVADPAWARDVETAIVEQPDGLDDDALRAAVERHLRRWYRSARIIEQHVLGRSNSQKTWYVFRDGKIRAPNERLERLYGSLAAARQTGRESAAALESSRAAAASAGFDLDRTPTRGRLKPGEEG